MAKQEAVQSVEAGSFFGVGGRSRVQETVSLPRTNTEVQGGRMSTSLDGGVDPSDIGGSRTLFFGGPGGGGVRVRSRSGRTFMPTWLAVLLGSGTFLAAVGGLGLTFAEDMTMAVFRGIKNFTVAAVTEHIPAGVAWMDSTELKPSHVLLAGLAWLGFRGAMRFVNRRIGR